MSWIADRPVSYDPDMVWDETSATWVVNDARGGGRYSSRLVVINDQGEIYFGEV